MSKLRAIATGLFLVALLGGFLSRGVPYPTTNALWVNSATGSDSNNGSGPALAFATLQKCANTATAGMTCYIMPGSGYGGGTGGTAPLILSTSGSGPNAGASTCTSPISFIGYAGRPVISGTQAAYVIGGANPLSCIVISNIELYGWNASLTWPGVSANAGSGTAITNHVYNGYGIALLGTTGGTSSTSVNHITVTGVVAHDFPGNGIACNFCDYLTIAGSTTYNNALYSPLAASGISLYEPHNIDAGTGEKIFVTDNLTYANQNYVPEHSAIQLTTTMTSPTSAGSNLLHVASTTNVNFTEIILDVTNGCIPPGTVVIGFSTTVTMSQTATCTVANGATIQFGYGTDGEGIIIDDNQNDQSDSVAYVGRTLVAVNVVYGNGGAGISIARSNNVDIWNNTLYKNQISAFQQGSSNAPGEITDLDTNGSTIHNNISDALSGGPSGWSQATGTTTWSFNSFFGGNASHTLPGTNNVTTNPSFNNPTTDFTLQGGSPAIGAGTNSTLALVPNNFIGAAFANPPNMGAY